MKKLDDIRILLDRYENKALPASLQKSLKEFQARVSALQDREQLRIAIIGEFNAGKSTLLNKLLGEEYLAVGNLPCTPVPVRINYGETTTLTLIIATSDSYREESRPWCELRTLSQTGWTVPGLTGLRITVPSPFLRDHNIELVDTPGTNAASQEEHARLAANALTTVQASLFLTYCRQPISKSALNYIRTALDMGVGVGLLLTKLDVLDPAERSELIEEFPNRLKHLIPTDLDAVAFGTAMLEDNLDDHVIGVKSIRALISNLISGAWARRVESLIADGKAVLVSEIDRLLASESRILEESLAMHCKGSYTDISGFLSNSRMSLDTEQTQVNEWLGLIDRNLRSLYAQYNAIINAEFDASRSLYAQALNGDALSGVIFPKLQNTLNQLALAAFQAFVTQSLDRKLRPLAQRINDASFDTDLLRDIPGDCARRMNSFRLPAIPIFYNGPVGIFSIVDLQNDANRALVMMLDHFRKSTNLGLIELMNIFNMSMEDVVLKFEVQLQGWLKANRDLEANFKAQLVTLRTFREDIATTVDVKGSREAYGKKAA